MNEAFPLETAPSNESRNFSGENVLLARWTRQDSLARLPILELREDQMAAGAEEWNALNIPILADLFQVKKKIRSYGVNR